MDCLPGTRVVVDVVVEDALLVMITKHRVPYYHVAHTGMDALVKVLDKLLEPAPSSGRVMWT